MSNVNRSQLHELYYYMRLTRALEERLEGLYKQGKVAGGLYRSLGQEGESVGAAYALEDGDFIAPSTRNMGSLFVRGVSPKEMLLQYMARSDAPAGGKDNITHFSDVGERGFIGPISPLGTMISVLAGVALSFKMREESRVAMTFLGEGATRTGAAHEGINFAAVQRLPFVLVVEDNGWAFGTRTSEQTALENLVDMAPGYGIPGEQVDGNDVLAVYEASKRAVDRARSGGGMSLIEVKTYRMKGHAQHDAQKHIPPEELEYWRARDPIDRYIEYLTGKGLASGSELDAIDDGIEAELDRAIEEADASPMPEPGTALTEVYAGRVESAPWPRVL